MLRLQALRVHVHEAHLPELVCNERQDPFSGGSRGKAPVAIAGAELFELVIEVLHPIVGAMSLLPVSNRVGSVFLSVPSRLSVTRATGDSGTPLPFRAVLLLLATAARGSWHRRGFLSEDDSIEWST